MTTSRHIGIHKKRVTTLSGCAIHQVDAFGLRQVSPEAEEFTLAADHTEFADLVPANEIWVSRRHFPREGLFLIAHSLSRLDAARRGLSAEKADQLGLDAERAVRHSVTGEDFRDGQPHRRVPDHLYDRIHVTIPDPEGPIDVWLIDGMLARCWYKTDYAEGGHYVVYPWVPKGQIWIERDTDPREVAYIIVHEYLELRMMRDAGLSYDDAHPIASKIEFGFRRGRSGLPVGHGETLTKNDLRKLAAPEVFAHVQKAFLK